MPVGTFTQPNFQSQLGNSYKANIDNAISVFARTAGAFAVHERTPTSMGVSIDAGVVWDGNVSFSNIGVQNITSIPAPTTNSRKDLIVVNRTTGVATRIQGVESASPVDPAIPANNFPIARLNVVVGIVAISNQNIDDIRHPAILLPSALTLQSINASGNIIGAEIQTNGSLWCPGALYFTSGINTYLQQASNGINVFANGVNTCWFSSTLTSTGVPFTAKGEITCNHNGNANEGGQLTLGPGTSYTHNAFVDNFQDALRLFATAATNKTLEIDNYGTGLMTVNIADALNVGGLPIVHQKKTRITHQVTSGTGGPARVANAWTQQILNTIIYDNIGVTLSANRITLPAGNYEVSGESLFGATNFGNATGRTRLFNVTDNAAFGNTGSSSGQTSTANASNIKATSNSVRFTLGATKVIEVQYFCSGATGA